MDENEKRMADSYEIQAVFYLDGTEVVFGIDDTSDHPYLVSDCQPHIIFETDNYTHAVVGDDYLEMLGIFAKRVQDGIERSQNRKLERGIAERLSVADCSTDREQHYKGKVLVVDPGILQRDKRTADYQLVYATHGNGCNPNAAGTSVFAVEVYDGKKPVRYSRADILGVIKPERIPAWAKDNIVKLEKQQKDREPTR